MTETSSSCVAALFYQLLPGLIVVGLLVLGFSCRKKIQSELQAPLLPYVVGCYSYIAFVWERYVLTRPSLSIYCLHA